MSKILSGPFAARSLGKSVWLLTGDAADAPEVLVRGPRESVGFPPDVLIANVTVTWHEDGVDVTLDSPAGVRSFRAASVIVHEPNGRLYQSLPLAGFDADARRFWRRVFRLIRIPGGRLLLGLIARRRRGKGRPSSR